MGATTLVVLTAIGIAIFAVALYSEYARFRREGPHLAVTEFRIDRAPDAECPIWVSGLRRRLFSRAGSVGGYVFRASRADITLEDSSPAGFMASFLPLRHVASTECQYLVPHSLLIAGLVLCVLGLVEGLLVVVSGGADDYQRRLSYEALFPHLAVCVVLAMVSYTLYQALKRILIDVESRGGTHIGFSFRRGLVGDAPIGVDRALDLTETLNNLVLAAAAERQEEIVVGTT